MDLWEWQEQQRKQQEADNASSPLNDKFFGRSTELSELKAFIEDSTKKIFCLYGVPMIGKSTLVREFCKTAANYILTTIKFFNPENPDTTLEKTFANFDWSQSDQHLIVIENFEEALLWKGDQEHLHEVRFPKVKEFLQGVSHYQHIKLILESRFQIRNDFLAGNIISELSTKQLGKIERKELFNVLNDVYRHNSVQYDAFEEVCEKLNDHVWLIELAMRDAWMFEDVREAVQRPESLTQQLWDKIQTIIRKLPVQQKTLLCAFGIVNPISLVDLKTNLESIPTFLKKEELDNSLWSLRKKLLLVYDAKTQYYELNPFLREVCYTYLQDQKEMRTIEQMPFFQNAQRPKYDNILQAFEKGEYTTFFRLIKEKRRNREFETVLDILKKAYWLTSKPAIILNEIAVTYKWQKNYPKAIDIFENLIEKHNHTPAYNELAIIYKEQKNYPKAIEYLEKACDLGNIHSYNELAIVHKEQKNYPKAIEVLEKACDLGNIHSYNELAIVYKEQKNYPKAIEVLEKSLKINYKDVKTLNELAIVYKEQKNYPKAIDIFENLIEKHNHIPAYNELAIVYKEQKNYPKAIEVLEKSLKINYKDVKTLNELAIVYKEMGDLKNARIIVSKGLSIENSNLYLKTTLNLITKEERDYSDKNPVKEKQKILFVAANPSGESRLQTDTEYRIIKAEIKRGTHRDAFEFLQPQIAVTITELLRAMNEKPNIIHFSGHGNTDGIVITTDNNQSQVLPISAMERLFKPLQDITKIIILNSCYSVEQARSISKYGMYVVGNNLPIGDKAAIAFSKGLYNGISEGKEFKAAFNDAIIVVLTESPKYAEVIEVWKDGNRIIL